MPGRAGRIVAALCEHKRMPADGRLDPFDPVQQNGRFRRTAAARGHAETLLERPVLG